MKIGLLGLTVDSGNKGCEALAFSFLEILRQIDSSLVISFVEKVAIKRVLMLKQAKYEKHIKQRCLKNNFNIGIVSYRKIGNSLKLFDKNKDFDIVFDFTQGDSFTDIYGYERFDDWTFVKESIIKKKIPFVLGSQTIGPFNDKNNEKRASKVIKESYEVFARDQASKEYVKSISDREAILTTDVAFFLPYDEHPYEMSNKIGFNPSGLLWNGGYDRNNQFGLLFDYQEYCKKCIKYALSKGFEVHLIGHVVSDDFSFADNDCVAIKSLHEMFPETIVSPMFDTPMEAKTYISHMAGFTGARMHATIASISSGVPVLPFSYSRKFEGLFDTINYEHLVHGKEDSLEGAYNKFIEFINNLKMFKKDVDLSLVIIDKMKKEMLAAYKKVIEGCNYE